MKNILFILFSLVSYSILAQDKITVLSGSYGTYIETYNYYEWMNSYQLKKAIRLGPTSIKVLKEGTNTAIKWVKLNSEHRKQFSKEICRFRAMNKDQFEYTGYGYEYTNEYTVTFYGNYDGSFKLEIKTNNDFSEFIVINNIETLMNFKKLLNGESTNNDIDDIFKK